MDFDEMERRRSRTALLSVEDDGWDDPESDEEPDGDDPGDDDEDEEAGS